MSTTSPTPQSFAAFALKITTGAATAAQQQQIAAHYEGFLPTYDTNFFLVDWQKYEGGPNGNAAYSVLLPSGQLPAASAMAVALGYMSESQLNLPANLGIIRTPSNGPATVNMPSVTEIDGIDLTRVAGVFVKNGFWVASPSAALSVAEMKAINAANQQIAKNLV